MGREKLSRVWHEKTDDLSFLRTLKSVCSLLLIEKPGWESVKYDGLHNPIHLLLLDKFDDQVINLWLQQMTNLKTLKSFLIAFSLLSRVWQEYLEQHLLNRTVYQIACRLGHGTVYQRLTERLWMCSHLRDSEQVVNLRKRRRDVPVHVQGHESCMLIDFPDNNRVLHWSHGLIRSSDLVAGAGDMSHATLIGDLSGLLFASTSPPSPPCQYLLIKCEQDLTEYFATVASSLRLRYLRIQHRCFTNFHFLDISFTLRIQHADMGHLALMFEMDDAHLHAVLFCETRHVLCSRKAIHPHQPLALHHAHEVDVEQVLWKQDFPVRVVCDPPLEIPQWIQLESLHDCPMDRLTWRHLYNETYIASVRTDDQRISPMFVRNNNHNNLHRGTALYQRVRQITHVLRLLAWDLKADFRELGRATSVPEYVRYVSRSSGREWLCFLGRYCQGVMAVTLHDSEAHFGNWTEATSEATHDRRPLKVVRVLDTLFDSNV